MSVKPDEPPEIRGLLPIGATGREAKLLATLEPSRVTWANAAAARLFETSDLVALTRLIFGRPAQARPRVVRLARLAPASPVHLERVVVTTRFQRFGVTLACAAVPGKQAKTILLQEVAPTPAAADAARAAGSLPATPGLAPEFQAAAPIRPTPPTPPAALEPARETVLADLTIGDLDRKPGSPPRPGTRFIWRTDDAGRVSFVGGEMSAVFGTSALRVGDDVQARLRALPAEAGHRFADLVAAGHSSRGSVVDWPVDEGGRVLPLVLGGAPAPGGTGYRGFGVLMEAEPTGAVAIARDEPAAMGDPPLFADDLGSGPLDSARPIAPAVEPDAPAQEHPTVETVLRDPDPEQPDPASAPTMMLTRTASEREVPAEIVPEPRDITATSGGRIMPFPTFPAGATSKVVHLSSFKAGGPVPFVRPATPREPTRSADPEPAPVPDGLEAPQWAEAPGTRASALQSPETRLSSHERFNFDEIARALAALPGAGDAGPLVRPSTEAADPAPAPPARIEPEPRPDRDAWALLDAVPMGLLVSQAGSVLYANRALLDVLGYARLDELRQAGSLASLFADERVGRPDAAGAARRVSLTTRGGDTVEVDARVQKVTWNREPASLMSIRRSGDEEARARLAALGLDLRRSQDLAADLSEALDLAASGAGFLDPRGRILSLSRGAERLFGYDQREVVGDGCEMLFDREQRADWTEFFSGFVAAIGRASAFRRFSGRRRNGNVLLLGISLRRLEADRVCIVWQEAVQGQAVQSEVDMLRREAERASALKSEFLAKVSHEIRTPLNAILGFTEIIIEERFGALGNDRYREYLKDIHASGNHVVSLINDLLDLSRIEAGGDDARPVPIDVNAMLGECVAALQGQAHRDRIIMRTSFAARNPAALVDARAFRQIALNLLSNAVKFNEPGGQVIASTAVSESGQVVLRIRDTGPGMSDSEIETAMKPYRQLASPKASAGSGLGLPLTKAMVEASHGGLRIKSTPGQGTLVEVTFQRAPEPALDIPAQ